MKVLKVVSGLIVMLSLSSCAFLQTTSISSIPKNRKKPVTASVTKTVILGFNFDNDYINDLPLMLARKCPKGKVRGILTKHEVIVYPFVSKHNVSANGYCTAR